MASGFQACRVSACSSRTVPCASCLRRGLLSGRHVPNTETLIMRNMLLHSEFQHFLGARSKGGLDQAARIFLKLAILCLGQVSGFSRASQTWYCAVLHLEPWIQAPILRLKPGYGRRAEDRSRPRMKFWVLFLGSSLVLRLCHASFTVLTSSQWQQCRGCLRLAVAVPRPADWELESAGERWCAGNSRQHIAMQDGQEEPAAGASTRQSGSAFAKDHRCLSKRLVPHRFGIGVQLSASM